MLRSFGYGLLASWPLAVCLGLACGVVWTARPVHPADPLLIGLAMFLGILIGCSTILHAWGEEIRRQQRSRP